MVDEPRPEHAGCPDSVIFLIGHSTISRRGDGRAGGVCRPRRRWAVYRHLSGLALQDADVATVAGLIAERTAATVAVVSQTMDIRARPMADGIVVRIRDGDAMTALDHLLNAV
jgi:hypothetical protein